MALLHFDAIVTQKAQLSTLKNLIYKLKSDYHLGGREDISSTELVEIEKGMAQISESMHGFQSDILNSTEHMLSPESVLHKLKPTDSDRTKLALVSKMHEIVNTTQPMLLLIKDLVSSAKNDYPQLRLVSQNTRLKHQIITRCDLALEQISVLQSQMDNLDWLSYVLFNLIVQSGVDIAEIASQHKKELFWFTNISSWQAHAFAVKK